MKIYNTADVATGFLCSLIYGLAGSGKTPLLGSLPNPIIVSSEPGLLSLRSFRLPYVAAQDYKETMDVIAWLNSSKEASQFTSIGYDSISATSENILATHRRKYKDARQYSPMTTADTMDIVNGFMALRGREKHVVMTCKATEYIDQITGARTAEPFTAVPKLGPALPYHFDTVLNVRRMRNQDGSETPYLTCGVNEYCLARDRSGKLALYEPANLAHIIAKVNS